MLFNFATNTMRSRIARIRSHESGCGKAKSAPHAAADGSLSFIQEINLDKMTRMELGLIRGKVGETIGFGQATQIGRALPSQDFHLFALFRLAKSSRMVGGSARRLAMGCRQRA